MSSCFCLLYFGLNCDKPQYLSQMKSDLHETFRITSLWYIKYIYDVREDPILQVPSQELQVCTLRRGGSGHTSDHARDLEFGTQVNNDI